MIAPPTGGPAHGVSHYHCNQATEKGHRRNQGRSRPGADDEGGSEAGTRRHPEQIGVGKGVAKHTLVAGPGDGEHRADYPPHDHPWQSNLEQEPLLDLGQAMIDIEEGQPIEHAENR